MTEQDRRTERCQSGRSGRSRKPLCPVRGTVGSNPTLSAIQSQKLVSSSDRRTNPLDFPILSDMCGPGEGSFVSLFWGNYGQLRRLSLGAAEAVPFGVWGATIFVSTLSLVSGMMQGRARFRSCAARLAREKLADYSGFDGRV